MIIGLVVSEQGTGNGRGSQWLSISIILFVHGNGIVCQVNLNRKDPYRLSLIDNRTGCHCEHDWLSLVMVLVIYCNKTGCQWS